MSSRIFLKPFSLFLVAVICAAGMWTYSRRVLIPYQKSAAAAVDRPRGNLSDLYPRWLGARELLLHGRDPYSPEVSREIQTGYYGRPIDSSRPNDPHDEQGFAYPVYIVFGLAPTIGLPFGVVQRIYFWALLVLMSAVTLLWLRLLLWTTPPSIQLSLIALTLGSLGMMQGLRLQQISLLVAVLVAVAAAFLITDHSVAAGVVLAFATIKPQLVVLLLTWLFIWTVSDWRRRYAWLVSFLATMAVLTAASEWYLPHWIPRFWHAIREYQRYTGTTSLFGLLIGGSLGRVLELVTFAVFLTICWRERHRPVTSPAFAMMFCLVLATTILVVPTYGPYNQVFLIPAALILVKERRMIWQGTIAGRFLAVITVLMMVWPWISSVALTGLSFILSQKTIERAWAIPLWTVTQFPVGVGALMLVHYYQTTSTEIDRATNPTQNST
jgi:hypothetical protein